MAMVSERIERFVEEFFALQGKIDSFDIYLHLMESLLSTLSEEEYVVVREKIDFKEVVRYYKHYKHMIENIIKRIQELEKECKSMVPVQIVEE